MAKSKRKRDTNITDAEPYRPTRPTDLTPRQRLAWLDRAMRAGDSLTAIAEGIGVLAALAVKDEPPQPDALKLGEVLVTPKFWGFASDAEDTPPMTATLDLIGGDGPLNIAAFLPSIPMTDLAGLEPERRRDDERERLTPGDGHQLWQGERRIYRMVNGSWSYWADGEWNTTGREVVGSYAGPFTPLPSWVTWVEMTGAASA